jgi:hypothetical protein
MASFMLVASAMVPMPDMAVKIAKAEDFVGIDQIAIDTFLPLRPRGRP